MEEFIIKAKLEGRTRFDKETETFVGFCPRLKIYSQGANKDEAEAALKQSILQYLEVCIAHGSLDAILIKAGFNKVAMEAKHAFREFVSIEKAPDESVFAMEIPLSLVASEAINGRFDPPSSTCV